MELLKNLEGLTPDEQMTAVVELQKAAIKHLEEQKQASIGKSAELVIQGLKKIKSDFEAKFDSLNYDIQTKVASLKDGEQGLQGPKGDQGERGLDGSNGRDGRDGKDGKDGVDGVDGIGVRDAKIDFDGSLVISLTDGREINCGEVVSVDVAKQIQKVTHNIQTGAGGDSQTVLDAITAIQATIATYGTMATQNANNVAITGGAINNTTIGATTPSTGVFTTLTATGQTSLGGTTTTDVVRIYRNNTVTSDTASFTAPALSFIPPQVGFGAGILRSSAQLNITTGNTGSIVLQTASTLGFGGTTQAQVSHTASAVNYVQVTGAATTGIPVISAQGSDASVSLALQSKGTSPVVFHNGSSQRQFRIDGAGVGTNYFGVASSATAFAPVFGVATQSADTNVSAVFQSKGTGAIDLAAGSLGVNISNGGTVTAITRTNNGTGYTSAPTVAITAPTTAGGVQATATATVSAGSLTGITITNAGSGYVEQPTVTFSGGGGSGAAAYPTVGSGTTVRSLGASIETLVDTTTILHLRAKNTSGGNPTNTSAAFGLIPPQSNFGAPVMGFISGPYFSWGGTGAMSFSSNASNPAISGNSGSEQFRISHTASAVNYVQVTGAATGSSPIISSQGSDANARLVLNAKGSSSGIDLLMNGARQVFIGTNGSAVNYLQLGGTAAGAAPSVAVQGSDTNIDLALTPKGTGRVKFGTYTANMALTIQGYIEIVDSGGTVRKLAVIA
jgi:hypothetical protein